MTNKTNRFSAAMVWLFFTFFYCYQYILRILPNIIREELAAKFDISATQFGTFASIFYLGYVVFHIPFGIAFGRLDAKIILLSAILLTVLGLAPTVYLADWHWIVAGRLLIGVGSSAAIVGAIQLFRIIFVNHFSRALGAIGFFGLITVSWLGEHLLRLLIQSGLESGLSKLMFTGLGLAAAVFIFFPSFKPMEAAAGVWSDTKRVLGNKKLIFVGIMAGLMISPLEGFGDGLGNAFMQAVYNLDRLYANSAILAIFFGSAVGSALLPVIAERTRSSYGVTLLAALIMAVGFISLISGLVSQNLLVPLCFTIGFFGGYQVIVISKIVTYVPEKLSGMAGSIGNMILMSFGPIFHQLMGFIMDNSWDGGMLEGVRVYPKQAYLAATAPIPAAMLLAAAGFIWLIFTERCRGCRSFLPLIGAKNEGK